MRFVLDNSVAMRWLPQHGSGERSAYAAKVLTQENSELLVQETWALEAASVMLKAQTKQVVTEARRFKLASYDAASLELAMREGLPLATLDGNLRSALAQLGVALA